MENDRNEMTGQPGNPGETGPAEKKLPLPVWDECVRLPPLPSREDVDFVYSHLVGLSQMNLRVEFPEKTLPGGRLNAESLFDALKFLGPMKNDRGEKLSDYPEICYFIEDPFIIADEDLRRRKAAALDELYFALRNPDDWTGFWGTAIRELKVWAGNYQKLGELSRKACEIWPGIPENTLPGFWLAQMAMVWMNYGRSYFMDRKDGIFKSVRDGELVTREIWDPVQSLGEWGASYLRAWWAGFFDTIWHQKLLEAPPEKKMSLLNEMYVTMRIVKGRYLMLCPEGTGYAINPTYSEEYMLLF